MIRNVNEKGSWCKFVLLAVVLEWRWFSFFLLFGFRKLFYIIQKIVSPVVLLDIPSEEKEIGQ